MSSLRGQTFKKNCGNRESLVSKTIKLPMPDAVQHGEKNTVIQLNSLVHSWTRSFDVNTESEIFLFS